MLLSLLALATLVAVHLVAHRLTFLRQSPRSRLLSFAAGVSLAYVFLHLLPELAHGQRILEMRFEDLPWIQEYAIYILALAGLVAFYTLERCLHATPEVGEPRDGGKAQDSDGHPLFWMHLAVFALYSLIVGCLLVHQIDTNARPPADELALFTFAMALHFTAVDVGLREDFPSGWRRIGRFTMSGALVVGWAYGSMREVDPVLLLPATALLGGGILLNVLKEELPRDRDARVGWLVAGALTYLVGLAVA